MGDWTMVTDCERIEFGLDNGHGLGNDWIGIGQWRWIGLGLDNVDGLDERYWASRTCIPLPHSIHYKAEMSILNSLVSKCLKC